MNASVTASSSLDQRTVLSVLGIVGVVGLLANGINVYIVYAAPRLRTSFGLLCASHSVSEVINLLIVSGWTTLVLLVNPAIASTQVSMRVGQLAAGICLVTTYTVLLKALNRYIAITHTLTYARRFSNRQTTFYIAVAWLIGFLHSVPLLFDSCDFMFNASEIVWHFSDTSCGHFLAFYVDFVYSCALMGVVLLLDSVTLHSLWRYQNLHATGDRRRRHDVRCFLQSCLTSLLQLGMLVSFHVFSRFAATPWTVFLTTTFAWGLANAVDGVLNAVFNARFLTHSKCAKLQGSSGRAATTVALKPSAAWDTRSHQSSS